jgi:hypothetical protein
LQFITQRCNATQPMPPAEPSEEETIAVAHAAAEAASANNHDDDGDNDDVEITVADFELLKVVGAWHRL